jgi:hypothetical protein
MIADFPHALANVLATVQQGRLGYVLYRDPASDRKVVVLVGGSRDAAAFHAILRTAGAEDAGASDDRGGHDFILRASSPDGALESDYLIEIKTSGESTGIANLLWLAATDAGGAAARESIEREP